MENLDAESIATLIKGGVTTLSVALGSKPAAMLIEKVSSALGWYTEPKQIVRKARAEAAATLIKAEADQEVKSLEQRVAIRVANEELKHQRNMESIVIAALPNISEDAMPGEIDDDWLNRFFDKCRLVSNEEVQYLWSHILSGEANQPGTFSPRTIQMLSVLTKEEALAFRRICSFVWTDEDRKPVLILRKDVLEAYEIYNVQSTDLYQCQEAGLVVLNHLDETLLHGENVSFSYFGRQFNMATLIEDDEYSAQVDNIPVGFVKLTLEGRELARICTGEPNWDYMHNTVKSWAKVGIIVSE